MPQRPQITLSREELDRAEIPMNHVLVKIIRSSEGLKTNAGITVGFLTDDVFAEGEDSHSANMAEICGVVEKVPDRLFFDKTDPNSMDWETDMELQVGDTVWYSLMEAKNSVQLVCDGVVYKSVPYQDCYVAKRRWVTEKIGDINISTVQNKVIPLNGYVLCKPVNLPKLSHLDAISEGQIDKSRGIIAFIGKPVKTYLRDSYSHIDDLCVGDGVLFDNKAAVFYLERFKHTAIFDNGNQYWCVQRRRISMVLNR